LNANELSSLIAERVRAASGSKVNDNGEQVPTLRRRTNVRHGPAEAKQVAGYYKKQSQLVEQFQELENFLERTSGRSDEESRGKSKEEEDEERQSQLALQISFYANIVLLGVKLFAAVSSGSLSIITSALDSFLDLVSGFILFVTDKSIRKQNKYLYPIGKSRMQPLGIIVFSCIMGTLGFQVLIEGIRQLVGEQHTHHLEHLVLTISIMVGVIVLKFFLFLFCRKSKSPSVQAYAQDHRNDVATNIVGLAAALVGDRLYYWVDPLGAILLAAYIIVNWSQTAMENIKSMVGVSAPPEFLAQLTYLAWNHHPDIVLIDTIRAYTFGPKYFVEVDVVLEENMPLRRAHDIGEALQNRIELMEDVERAFVHLDFESEHAPEH
jgi:cation diffusion facilitator family transporter